jgi:hypothetical protein
MKPTQVHSDDSLSFGTHEHVREFKRIRSKKEKRKREESVKGDIGTGEEGEEPRP